jgi:transcriptional regulator with XRE-family HTH domain
VGSVDENSTLGDRLRETRKRCGLTQADLARASGVSVSLIRKLEQDERDAVRMETLRKLALALRVRTTFLAAGRDAEDADSGTAAAWEPVRSALYREPSQPEEPPTPDGIAGVLRSVRVPLAVNRYSDVLAVLPGLMRDAGALEEDETDVRSRVLNLAGWLLVMTRQWDAAGAALRLARDAAGDRLDAAAAVNTLCWSLLRQGRLGDAGDLAARWADQVEPRFSKATAGELAIWGRLLLNLTNAAIRDGRPGEARDAVRLARAAADRIGRDVLSDASTTRTFGPVTVEMIVAENAAISGHPDEVLSIAARMPRDVLHPSGAGRAGTCRHRLDVANAHVQLRQYGDAVAVMAELRDAAPEWIVQQRYARDILGEVVRRRRTLTGEMRSLADFIALPL